MMMMKSVSTSPFLFLLVAVLLISLLMHRRAAAPATTNRRRRIPPRKWDDGETQPIQTPCKREAFQYPTNTAIKKVVTQIV